MQFKKVKINWQSVEPQTGTPYAVELEFDHTHGTPVEAYAHARRWMECCLITDGAQIEPTEFTEEE